jgi:hypothetical protein
MLFRHYRELVTKDVLGDKTMRFKFSDLTLFKASTVVAGVILAVFGAWLLLGAIGAADGKAIETIKPGLEVLSYAATFVTGVLSLIAIVGVRVALQQLAVSKGDIRLRSQREAGVLAVQMCERFAAQVIPVMDQCWHLMQKKNPEAPPTQEMLFSDLGPVEKWLIASRPHQVQIIYLMNSMESIAIYFEKKLADEELGFGPLAFSFCMCVEMFWPVMALNRPDNAHRLYPNTVALYHRWKVKLKEIGLDIQNKKLEAERRSLPQTQPRQPLGTEQV